MKPQTASAGTPTSANAAADVVEQARQLAALYPSDDLEVTPGSTRGRLLVVAMQKFSDQGFEATTMRDLAGAVGIKAPAIYNHFGSKETLLLQALRGALGLFFHKVVGPVSEGPPIEQLQGLVRRHVLHQLNENELALAGDALLSRHALERLLPNDHHELVAAQHAYVQIIEQLIAPTAQADVEFAVTALSVLSICERVATWFRPEGPLSQEEVADEIWRLVLRMLGR